MELYRVFPYLAAGEATEPGGALYIPPQGSGRIDNPDRYSVLYLSDAASGAIAEAFGRFPEWTGDILAGSPKLPGSVRAVGRYILDDRTAVCNLDDPEQLLALNLRPSDVVSRHYARTQAWALRLYDRRAWAGVRWWSYYDSKWASFGLWDSTSLALEAVEPLTLDHPSFQEGADTIGRRILPAR